MLIFQLDLQWKVTWPGNTATMADHPYLQVFEGLAQLHDLSVQNHGVGLLQMQRIWLFVWLTSQSVDSAL
jgi:hypothetical protein